MTDLAQLIDMEVEMYVGYCRLASNHDDLESWYRLMAHAVFMHIQDMRQTGKLSYIGKYIK